MTKRKQKSQKNHEQQIEVKKTHKKEELVTIKLPSSFPFQDLCCRKEHKELFEGLFGGE